MHRRFSRSLISILLLGLLSGGLSRTAVHVSVAHAAVPAGQPAISPRSLALPARAFPRWTKPVRKSLSNRAAGSMSALHSISFDQLGRITGEAQSVHYRAGTPVITLRYLASVFPTTQQAAAADQDAVATLWRTGVPLRIPGLPQPGFLIALSGGHSLVELVADEGPIEIELACRYQPASAGSALGALAHLATIAIRHDAKFAQIGAAPPAATSGSVLPAVFTSPPGTGPVTESPSLMTQGAAGQSWVLPGSTLATGEFRSGSAAIAKRVRRPVSVAVAGSISQYIRTADLPHGGVLYDSASLYGDVSSAANAFAGLQRANHPRPGLRVLALLPAKKGLTRLIHVDQLRSWVGHGETIVAMRYANVISIFSGHDVGFGNLGDLANRLIASIPTALHAQGTQIQDAFGDPVMLQGVNWYGFEQQDFVAGGLDFRSYQDILMSIKQMGYNTVRLPFSNQMVEQNPVVTDHLNANPELRGFHALDIMDRIIATAGALGLRIILDDHRSDAGWSAEENGLWYTAQYPDTAFVADWTAIGARYAGTYAVAGADLRNEPHGTASWGDGNPATDWQLAAQRAGDAVLAADPHLLVMVEGVQFYNGSNSYWWGGNLMGVAAHPVELQFPDGTSAHSQLVYSAHDYGKDNCGTGCAWFSATTTYAGLSQLWDQYWGYIAENPGASYTAPVWVGEFGTCNYQQSCVTDTTPGSQGQWFSSLMRYIAQHNFGWAYWSINGTESTAPARVYGSLDWYGLFDTAWQQPRPWIAAALTGLQSATTTQS
ncbi:MAG: glycoside hydrolase family 5 protein [Chloroflexota bacterium]